LKVTVDFLIPPSLDADKGGDLRHIMCEQSATPKALVDIVVSDPDKLDELEKQAEG
jgi:hypothetical protein